MNNIFTMILYKKNELGQHNKGKSNNSDNSYVKQKQFVYFIAINKIN